MNKRLHERLTFLNEEAPTLLKGGEKQDLVRVLRCRLCVEEDMENAGGYAWYLLIKGDSACAPHRENLHILTLEEAIDLGATCDLSWYSPVWQNRHWLWHQQYIGGAS